MNAVIDENLPKSFARVLTELRFTPFDIRACGLSGASDKTVFHFAQKLKAVLFTADLDFANTLIFPLGKHYGICVLRFPNQMAVSETNLIVKELLAKIPKGRLSGSLAIISPGKARLRSLL